MIQGTTTQRVFALTLFVFFTVVLYFVSQDVEEVPLTSTEVVDRGGGFILRVTVLLRKARLLCLL